MSKIIFVLFQGGHSNLNSWKNTKSDLLKKLKTLGTVYMYQNKLYNVYHYDINHPYRKEFDNDINFDLSYINMDNHIKMVYGNLKKKYKTLDTYKIIPIGWSLGGFYAQYFSQKYKYNCSHSILLDSAVFTPKNIKQRLNTFKLKLEKYGTKMTNTKYKKILNNIKKNNTNGDNIFYIINISIYNIFLFISKNINTKFDVPTTSFVNFQIPTHPKAKLLGFPENKKNEIKLLKKYNPDKFKAFTFINKTHKIFDNKQPANKIIKYIKTIISSIEN